MNNLQKEIHLGLTGHRPNKLGGYNLISDSYLALQRDLESYIYHQLQTYQTVVCHSGLALGGDTLWSKAALHMRTLYPSRVKFHAEIPMMEQASPWFKKSDIDFWQEQVDTADFKSVYGSLADKSDQERKYLSSRLLNVRNEGMVDNSDIMLAIHDGTSGGTNNARNYATKTGKPVVVIDPAKYFA